MFNYMQFYENTLHSTFQMHHGLFSMQSKYIWGVSGSVSIYRKYIGAIYLSSFMKYQILLNIPAYAQSSKAACKNFKIIHPSKPSIMCVQRKLINFLQQKLFGKCAQRHRNSLYMQEFNDTNAKHLLAIKQTKLFVHKAKHQIPKTVAQNTEYPLLIFLGK